MFRGGEGSRLGGVLGEDGVFRGGLGIVAELALKVWWGLRGEDGVLMGGCSTSLSHVSCPAMHKMDSGGTTTPPLALLPHKAAWTQCCHPITVSATATVQWIM